MTDPTIQREKVPAPGRPAQPLETALFPRHVRTEVAFLLGFVFGR